MPRLSIDLGPQERRQFKTMAALKGQSIKDHALSRALVDMPDPATMTDEEALQALKRLLAPRLAEAEAGDVVTATADDIKRDAKMRRQNGSI